MKETLSTKDLAKETAFLSLTEVGIGSILHALYVPFAGHFLSLNQGFVLSSFLFRNKEKAGILKSPIEISNCTALLKALSPTGKKLTPMLAISAQGFFFSLGPLIFGVNLLGILLGMFLLSLWGFFQPLLLTYLFFGGTFFTGIVKLAEGLERLTSLSPRVLLFVLLGIVVSKVMLAVFLGFLSHYRKGERLNFQEEWRQTLIERTVSKNRPRIFCKELFSPLFLFSLFLTAVFSIYSDPSFSSLAFSLLRPLAVGLMVYFIFHWVRVEDKLLKRTNSLLSKAYKAFNGCL